jgi:uncharacterized membrane protein
MPTTYTSEQVINKAASDLGKWVPGESLGAVEHDTISDALDATLAETQKILYIGDRDQIPDFAYECIASLTAARASSAFSNVPLDYGSMVEPLERRLRYLVAQTPTYEPLVAYYF